MGPVLVSPGGQLDLNQGFQAESGNASQFLDVIKGWIWTWLARAHHLSREDDVHGVTHLRLGRVQEDVDAAGMAVDESYGLKRRANSIELRSIDHKVDISRISNRRLIDRTHPCRDGISTDHRERNVCRTESGACSSEALFDLLHRSPHASKDAIRKEKGIFAQGVYSVGFEGAAGVDAEAASKPLR